MVSVCCGGGVTVWVAIWRAKTKLLLGGGGCMLLRDVLEITMPNGGRRLSFSSELYHKAFTSRPEKRSRSCFGNVAIVALNRQRLFY